MAISPRTREAGESWRSQLGYVWVMIAVLLSPACRPAASPSLPCVLPGTWTWASDPASVARVEQGQVGGSR